MRPVHLKFSGLRSYRQEASIDFTDLNLVGIIGDTGAGKSTIIEALSLALYAKKTWEGGGSVVPLHTKSVNTMRIEFKFHIDGHDWIVVRSRSQNTTASIDKLTSPTGGGPNVDGAKNVTDKIEKLLGLDHKQFLSVIVLPQGRFDTLLTATKTDRDKILTSILGLDEIVTTREAIATVRAAWEPKTLSLRAQRKMYPQLPAAELAEAQTAIRAKTIEHEALRDAIAAGAALETARSGLRQTGIDLKRAIEALPAIDQVALRRLTECAQLAEELSSQHVKAAEIEKQSDGIVSVLQIKYDDLIGDVTVPQMIEAKTQLNSTAGRFAADLLAATEARTAHAALVDQAPTEIVDPQIVQGEAAARTALHGAEINVEATKGAIARGRSAWVRGEKVRVQVATTEELIAQKATAVEAARTTASSASTALEQATQIVESCAEALQRSKVLNAVAEIAAQCVAGDDCPICEQNIPSTFTPPIRASDDNLDMNVKSAKQAYKECESTSKEATRLLNQAETNLVRLTQELATHLEEASKAVELGLTHGADMAAQDEASALKFLTVLVDDRIAELESAKDVANNAQIALTEAKVAIGHKQATYKDRLTATASQAAETEKRVDAHHRLLNELPETLRPARTTTESIIEKATELDRAINSATVIATQLVDARSSATAAQVALAEITARNATEVAAPINGIVSALNNRNARINELCVMISEADASSNVATTPDLDSNDKPFVLVTKAAGLTSHHQTVEARAIDVGVRLRAQHSESETAIATLVKKFQCADIDELRAKSGSNQTQLEHAVMHARKLETDAATALHLDAFLAVAEPFVANLAILVEALKDKQFIGYLVKTRETQLLSEATRRLKSITNGRFGFGADFTTVDIASGEQRTSDTLSGGERFQAALALALALVEITTRNGGHLNAIFIDEGFGSLDANALDGALGTLNKIAGSGKLVALISHLTQVADNVDQVLRVTKTETHGSHIEHLNLEAIERLLNDDARSGLTG